MSTRILVTGATGKQGGALINALLSPSSAQSLKIFAVTRNPESSASRALSARNVTLIQGDIATSSRSVFSQINELNNGEFLDAAFLVSALAPPKPFGKKPPSEEEQALPFIDAAVASGVRHLVFTSVERGINADTDPTTVPHFASKFRIEQYLKNTCEKSALPSGGKMTWTILRPTCFMDMLTNDFIGRTFAAMWAGVGSKPLQMVATQDVGTFAARAILDPQKYAGKVVALAGDELTLDQAKIVFRETLGKDLPVGYKFMGSMIQTIMSELGVMFEWFKTDGFTADVRRCNEQGAMTFGQWLKKYSSFKEGS